MNPDVYPTFLAHHFRQPKASPLARKYSAYLWFCLWFFSSLSIYLSICLSTCLSICLSIRGNHKMLSLKGKRESRQLLWYIIFYNYFSWLINFVAAQNIQCINCRDTNGPAHLKWEPSRVGYQSIIIVPIIKREAELPFSNLAVDSRAARSQALFITITTSENERFSRTYHQSLEPHQRVYKVKHVRGYEMWQ